MLSGENAYIGKAIALAIHETTYINQVDTKDDLAEMKASGKNSAEESLAEGMVEAEKVGIGEAISEEEHGVIILTAKEADNKDIENKEKDEKETKGSVQTVEGMVNLTRKSVDDKLARYLLNIEHHVGGSKAKWFKKALGFTQDNMDDLAKQRVFDSKKAVQTGVSEYGTKFNQTIYVNGANGKVIDVTFAWMKNAEDDVVRLVTAIPTKK